ncbi:hypothetical protein [Rhodoblastus sp.]|uniref:hypothetical protein n=1 Tax=Rhodoblastus sp. TaxID=1962975 RepID=UPI003F9A383E
MIAFPVSLFLSLTMSIDPSDPGGDASPSTREMQIKQYDKRYDLQGLRESGYGHVRA